MKAVTKIMPISDKQHPLLVTSIPYRIRAVVALEHALRLRDKWDTAPDMTMFADGKPVLEGNINAYTNPAIEAGLIHCRALLEFLGLREENRKLCTRNRPRKNGDLGIEHFEANGTPLKIVDVEAVLSRYKGDRDEAEQALVTVFRLTNKRLAHITNDACPSPEEIKHTLIVCKAIPALMVSYLYTPLGLPAPNTAPQMLWLWQQARQRVDHWSTAALK